MKISVLLVVAMCLLSCTRYNNGADYTAKIAGSRQWAGYFITSVAVVDSTKFADSNISISAIDGQRLQVMGYTITFDSVSAANSAWYFSYSASGIDPQTNLSYWNSAQLMYFPQNDSLYYYQIGGHLSGYSAIWMHTRP